MKKLKFSDGAKLLQNLFARICMTAHIRSIHNVGHGFVVSLGSGPNEGQAAGLFFQHDRVEIEFHRFAGSATDIQHEQGSFLTISMRLEQTDVSDSKRGRLWKQAFSAQIQRDNLLLLTTGHTKVLPFFQMFLGMLESLPCHYIWDDELAAAREAIKAEYEPQSDLSTPAVV